MQSKQEPGATRKSRFLFLFFLGGLLCGESFEGSLSAGGQPSGELEVPAGVRVLKDLVYREVEGKRLHLDLYLPEEGERPLPLVIWVHGGGWRAGSKERPPAVGLTARGYALASLQYRLSSESKFPAQIEDCKAAVRWLRAHAGEYGLDPDRFGAWGSSAGGHLVALLGTAGEVPEWEKGEYLEFSSRVQAVCDFFGPTDFLKMDAAGSRIRHADPDSPESQLIGGPIEAYPERVARANPIRYVDLVDPPFLIVHGDQDELVPLHQSELLYQALREAEVPVVLQVLRGAGHGGTGFRLPGVQERVEALFDRHLKGGAGVSLSFSSRLDSYVFKKTPQGELGIHVHFPAGWTPQDRRPAVVFFFGGGWRAGNINQFLDQADYLAWRGMVAARADYRVRSRHGTAPQDCVEDGKSAIRWLRRNASRLGIDPSRIAAAGGSAGGHVALASFTTSGLEAEGEETSISSRPNLLVLFNPVFDVTVPGRLERVGSAPLARRISPLYHLTSDLPPSLLLFGDEDPLLEEGRRFVERARELGIETVLYIAEGQRHGFLNRSPWKEATLHLADTFLVRHGYLSGPVSFSPPPEAVLQKSGESPGRRK